ncbi:MAG TPA: OmpA family protein [Gammaproteobacteria bacterium]
MRKLIVAIIATTFAGSGWAAESNESKKFEHIGLGSGALVGAAAGGPIGLILGAAAGIFIGDRYDEVTAAQSEYEQRYTEAREEVASLNALVESSERQIAMNERQISMLESRNSQDARAVRDAVQEALDVHILFKTDQTEVGGETQQRLMRLARLVAQMDGMAVQVGGFADARGDAEHNAQLSALRAASVRQTLIDAGVPASRITVDAYGEQRASASEEDLDGLAFDRRVQLTLIPTGSSERVARE